MKVVVALGNAILVAGCASVPTQQPARDTVMVCDEARIQNIDRAARLAHTQLHWVRCPMIRRDQAPKEPEPPGMIERMLSEVRPPPP
jgi:hypothetical protein